VTDKCDSHSYSTAQGRLIEMGEIKSADLDGTLHTYPMALLITFESVEEIRKAIKDGVCRFEFK
jgi:hypothetical protein